MFLGNNDSPPAVPLNKGGNCDYSNCGACVANSNCGFCTIKVNKEYLYGTCSDGSIDGDDFSDDDIKCVVVNETENFMNKTSNISEWYFDHCPDNNYAVFSLVVILLHMISGSAGFVTLPWVINSEIYPTWARGQAASLSSFFNWFANMLQLLTFLSMVDAFGLPQVIVIYGVLSFISVIFILLFLPETSNLPLEETERLFDKPYFLTWCSSHTCRKMNGNMKYSAVNLHQQARSFEISQVKTD